MRVKFMQKKIIFLFFLLFNLEIALSQDFTSSIAGFVVDSTGEALAGANIFIQGTTQGTTTNTEGYYRISEVPPGDYEIIFSYISYQLEKRNIKVKSDDKIILNITLKGSSIQFRDVIVTADEEGKRREDEINSGYIALSKTEINIVPKLVEADVLRSFQTLPGVLTDSDYTSALNVRGGSIDQNLVLLDGMEIYNPYHMGGLWSTFIPESVKNAELIRGGFRAEYGGKLSSVLNINTKDKTRKDFSGLTSVGFLSSRLMLEAPIPFINGSLFVGGRRTYLDIATKILHRNNEDILEVPYYFYDLQGKINLNFNSTDKISLSYYFGDDKFELTPINLNWGNKILSIPWTHIFSDELMLHLIYGKSQFKNILNFGWDAIYYEENSINDNSIKASFEYLDVEDHNIKFGVERKEIQFKFLRKVGGATNTEFNDNPILSSAFFQIRTFIIKPIWYIETGFRFNSFKVKINVKSDPKSHYINLEPRIGMKYIISERFALKGFFGNYHQYLQIVSPDESFISNIWIPIDNTVDPGSSKHFILGAEGEIIDKIDFEIEIYYKDMFKLLEIKETLKTKYDNPSIADNFYVGKGEAYGVDFAIRKRSGKLSGWIGYSLSKTIRQFDEINNGQAYYPPFNRMNNFNIVVNYDFDYSILKGFSFMSKFSYGTGQYYTKLVGTYKIIGEEYPFDSIADVSQDMRINFLPGRKSNAQLPDYHRLDIGFEKVWTLGKVKLKTTFQIINIYNRKNIWFTVFDTSKTPAEKIDVPQLPFLPSFEISLEF
jgi:hypothetical protein